MPKDAGTGGPALSRRRFLTAAGAGAAAAALGAAVPLGTAAGAGAGAADDGAGGAGTASGSGPAAGPALIPFHGVHQAGVDRPVDLQAATVMAAFDVVARDRDELRALFAELTTRSRDLASARLPEPADPVFPPIESGILGSSIGPADLTITVSVGASLFDDRFGLADRKPRQLVPMPMFMNDQLAPESSHGDIAIGICAADELACIHGLRYLMLGTRSTMALRWMVEGFQRRDVSPDPARTTTRNLMGFKDGTANLVPGTPETDALVWVAPGDPEPEWAVGGTYLVVRTIRMFIERWDRTALDEQEAIIGRTKRTGAPLGQAREEDIPDYASDPTGARIPLDAHIRLANPRTPGSEKNRILRRGFSFSRGFDEAGQLDQGLLFMAYQRDLAAGFATIQARLDGEPLEEYIRPVGGGYFFTLPGVMSEDGILGEGLLA